MQVQVHVLKTARDTAAERVAVSGHVTMEDFLSRMPYSVDETYGAIELMVSQGELIETDPIGPKPADRTFIFKPGD